MLEAPKQLNIEPRSPKIVLGNSFGVIFVEQECPRASKSVPKASKSVPRASQKRPRARQERPKSGFIVSRGLYVVVYSCRGLYVVVVQRRWEAGGEGGER